MCKNQDWVFIDIQKNQSGPVHSHSYSHARCDTRVAVQSFIGPHNIHL